MCDVGSTQSSLIPECEDAKGARQLDLARCLHDLRPLIPMYLRIYTIVRNDLAGLSTRHDSPANVDIVARDLIHGHDDRTPKRREYRRF